MKRALIFLAAIFAASFALEFWQSGLAWSSVRTALVQTFVITLISSIAFAIIDRQAGRRGEDER